MPISVATFCHIWSLNLTQESVLIFFGVYCAETRRVRVRECAGVHLKPKMWAQNEGTDDQNEAVWAFRVVEWYIPCVESCEFVFLLFVPNGSLLEVVLIP